MPLTLGNVAALKTHNDFYLLALFWTTGLSLALFQDPFYLTAVTCITLLMKWLEIRLYKSSVTGLLKAVLLSCGLCEHCKRKMPAQQP